MESYNGMMKESLVQYESQEEEHNQINGRNTWEFEYTKEKHQELQNDISNIIVRP